MVDFTLYEGEDIDLRITITDVNGDLPTSIAGSTIVWVATGSVGGVPIIEKGTGDSSVTITSATTPYVITVHLVEADTRNKIGIMYYETSIVISGNRRVLRLLGGNTGTFEVKQSDTDEIVVA